MPRLGDLGYLWHHKAAFTRLPPPLHFIWYKIRPLYEEGKIDGNESMLLGSGLFFGLLFVCRFINACARAQL